MTVRIYTIWLNRHEALDAFRNLLKHGEDFLPEIACGVIRHALKEEHEVRFQHLEQEVLGDAMAEIISEAKCKVPTLEELDGGGFKLTLLSNAGTGCVSLSVTNHGSFIAVQHDSQPQTVYEWAQHLNLPTSWKAKGIVAGVPLYDAVFRPNKYQHEPPVKIWAGGESHGDGGCL